MTTKIHPTAIVHEKAQLGADVEIGAYSIIGPKVVLGDECFVGNYVNITGKTTIGSRNKLYHFSSIGEIPQDKKYQGEETILQIGDANTIREFCTINAGTALGGGVTSIGNNNWIMAYVHIAHDCQVGNDTILANGTTLAGHVIIQDWAFIGGLSPIHQFCVVGKHAMLAGASSLVQDLPPYVLASGDRAGPKGINVEGLKRRGFTYEQIDNVKHAYEILYDSGFSFEEAVSIIEDLAVDSKEVQDFLEFFKISKRGIIR